MKRIWKKAVALILAVVMTLQLVPSSAYAATGSGSGSGYNEQVMAMLEDICDTEEDAERYYAMLEEYGFMDSDGNAAESWSITMGGEPVTLDEIRAMLEEDDCDKNRYVVVDGTPVTLENLETMIAIEDYISYLEETYYTPQAWSEEALANLDDLVQQINEDGGIELVTDDEETETGSWESSVDHEVRLKVEVSETKNVEENSSITVTVMPEKAQKKDITFTWRTVNGSAEAEMNYGIETIVLPSEEDDESDDEDLSIDKVREMLDSGDYDPGLVLLVNDEKMTLGELGDILDGKITIPAYSTDQVELTVDVGEVQGRVNGSGTFLVQIYDVTNALFDDGTARWEQAVSVQSDEKFHYQVNMTETADAFKEGDYIINWGVEAPGALYTYLVQMEGTSGHQNSNDYANLDIAKDAGYDSSSNSLFKDYAKLVYRDASSVTFDLADALNELELDGGTYGATVSLGNMDLYRSSFSQMGLNRGLADAAEFWSKTYESPVKGEDGVSSVYGSVRVQAENKNGASIGETNLDVKDVFSYGKITETQLNFSPFDLTTKNLTANDICKVTVQVPDLLYVCYASAWHELIFYPTTSKVEITLSLWDATETTEATLSVADGIYYAGQSIPITVTFNYPMKISGDMFLNINDQKLSPVEVGSTAETCTFLYEVQDADVTSLCLSGDEDGEKNTKYNLSGLGANGREVTVTLNTSEFEDGQISDGVKISTPDKSAAITGISAKITNPITYPVLNVSVNISSDEDLTLWLTNELLKGLDEATGTYYSSTLTVLYNGDEYPLFTKDEKITGHNLTAEIPIDLNITETDITRGVELMIDGEVSMTFYADDVQGPAMFLTEDDIDAEISVFQANGSPYEYSDENYAIWIQDAPVITGNIELTELEEGNAWSFGDTKSTTVYLSDGSLADENADFVWWIGDEDGNPDNTVANIDAAGKISAVGTAGTAWVYLTALNGDNKLSDESNRAVTVTAYRLVSLPGEETGEEREYLTFDVGLTPFLYIPYDEVSSLAGQDLTVYWTSNLCDKNIDEETGEEKDTDFEAVVTCIGDNGEDKTVYCETLTGTASSPASGVTIPGEVLQYTYGEDEKNVYTLTVSSVYEDVTYIARAEITLQPSPAVVTLGSLDSYYITDNAGSVSFGWTVDSFNYYGKSDNDDEKQFELQITRDGDLVDIVYDPESTSGNGTYSGSYKLEIGDVKTNDDPTSYRSIYTVTIAAKNGGDSTWSYDSFMLYVYDEEALDIWINGESAEGVTLSNVTAIADMTQDQILALDRDINLKAMVSVNYGQYAWAELTDQIAWASSDSSIAPVTYQQGSLYENIEHFSYTSYRPTTEFGITGREDGTVTISAEHVLTGISDDITVDVERLDNQLYLFQCYPQVTTTLYYTNGNGEEKTVTSAEDGAAAIYEESGIASDVYCQSTDDGVLYIGTIYNQNLKSGEGDWTLLERYPCNNLTLRRAAYAYMYLKNPDGTPYDGEITIRGGVYLDGKYVADALFDYNEEQNLQATQTGDTDYTLQLGSDGRLAITMDQTQWGTDTGAVNLWNDVQYVFEICLANDETKYYPMLVTIDATVNEAAYVGNGEAVVTFRQNPVEGKHAFIIGQMAFHGGNIESVLDGTGTVGPSEGFPTAQLYTMAMWWGEDEVPDEASLQLFTADGVAIAAGDGEYDISQTDYPFSDKHITTYSVRFDEDTIGDILDAGDNTAIYLEYYKDGLRLTRREDLTFTLTNMIGVEEVTDSASLLTEVREMGLSMSTDTDGASDNLSTKDTYVQAALNFASDSDYSTGDGNIFSIQLAPTSDPTKFLGFMEVNIGGLNMDDVNDDDDDDDEGGYYDGFGQVSYATSASEADDWDYWPGMDELETLAGKKSVTDYFSEAKKNAADGKKGDTVDDHDLSYSVGGYMETLIYYDYNSGSWKMKVLSGGFNAGAGYEWCWNFNTVVGVVPFTATLKIGAEAQVSLDALTAAYYEGDGTASTGSDILTELRMYLYIYFFAGVGIDYAVVAFKLGVYGQIDLDMRFDWLKRNYLKETGATPVTNDNTKSSISGQHFEMDGEVGLELVVKVLFVEYDKVLYSYRFSMFNKGTGDWDYLQDVWDSDKDAYDDMISGMLDSGSLSVVSVDGTPMMTLNLAATKEDVSYLESGTTWGSSISTLALDPESGLKGLSGNSYAYADPVVTDDGSIVAFLGIPDGEDIDSTNVSAMFATGSNGTYGNPGVIPDPEPAEDETDEGGTVEYGTDWAYDSNEDDTEADGSTEDEGDTEIADVSEDEAGTGDEENTEGEGGSDDEDVTETEVPGLEIESEREIGAYGDSELTIAGNGSFAVAAWTRQTVDIAKDDGAQLTEEDQRMMMDGTDIYVSVYTGGNWTTTRIENGGADLAPVVATNGSRAIVAWRSVASDNSTADITDFDQKDMILYKIYDGSEWSEETYTLYNGTSGNVKGITAGMLEDGTAAVAYAIDTDSETDTYTDREIVYAVIGTDGGVIRNVRATNDNYLDENPQLTKVKFGEAEERFLLGWYTEQTDDVTYLDGNDGGMNDQISSTADIRFIDFDDKGNATQLMPDSLSAAATGANVSITSDFAFTKGAGSIDNLSIVWSERTVSDEYYEHDVLKAVKFYTNDAGQITFTGAAELAEMPAGTLVDHFDAYTDSSDGVTVKAVILGTTYGADGTVTKEAIAEGGELVSYEVPSSETSMYTATENYENTIDVLSFLPDYEMLKLGAKTEIMFNIENTGIDPVTAISVTVGGTTTDFTGLTVLPGDNIQLYADYQVPGDAIKDETFTVTASFKSSAAGSSCTFGDDEDEENLIYMNLPDVQITDASIIREEKGERDILIKLNNTSDAVLGTNSNTHVRLSFYSDATYESPIEDLPDIEITDTDELRMIDEGGYSTVVTFDVGKYLEKSYGELTEIPETGVTVYIQAEVIDESTGEAQGETNMANNYEMVTCENLQVRSGSDVIITSTMDISGDTVKIKVDLQNTRLTTTETGNVIVTLLGEDGSIIAQKQSYNGTSGLITLEGEAKDTEEFTFKGITDVFTVSVIYTDMILDGDDIPEGLDTLLFPSLEENVTLDDFMWDEDAQVYVYSITVKDLTWVSMIAVARDAGAAITVNGETTDFYTVAMNLDLMPGETNVITIDVKNRNGTVTSYIFTIYDETDEVPAEELIGKETGGSGAAGGSGTGSDGSNGTGGESGMSSGTGDSSRPLMMFIIMIACAAVIVGIVVSGRRKRFAGKKE